MEQPSRMQKSPQIDLPLQNSSQRTGHPEDLHQAKDRLKTRTRPAVPILEYQLGLIHKLIFPRTIKDWNKLPQSTINQATKTSFKQSIPALIF